MEILLTPEEQQIQSYYDKIPYHNFEHALNVTKNAMFIADKLRNTLSLSEDDIDTLRKSALRHDAWYAYNHKEDFFKTKEDYSIHLMKQFYKNSLPKDKIQNISKTIEATKIEFLSYTTHIQKILKAADIKNLWGDFDTFENNTRKIKNEYEQLNNTKLDATVFLKKQLEIITGLLENKNSIKEIYFQKEHFDFYRTFVENIKKIENKYLRTEKFKK